MKKITFFASLFLMLGLFSCSSDDSGDGTTSGDKIIGTWKVDEVIYNGIEIELDQCDLQGTLEFDEDGSGTSTYYWMNENSTCELDSSDSFTWENVGGSTYAVTSEGMTHEVEVVFSSGNNRFTITTEDEFGTSSESFVRQ